MERIAGSEQRITSSEQLIEELATRTEHGEQLLGYLRNRKMLHGIKLDRGCRTSYAYIHEGTVSISTSYKRTVLLDRSLYGVSTQNEAVVRAFIHEMLHLYLFDPNAEKSEEIDILRDQATAVCKDGRGLSALGSQRHYRDGVWPDPRGGIISARIEEDITELIGLRIVSAQVFTDFMDFLKDPQNSLALRKMKLSSLDESTAGEIAKTVEDILIPVKET